MTSRKQSAPSRSYRRTTWWLIALLVAAWQFAVGAASAQTATAKRPKPADTLRPVDKKDPKLGHDWVRLEYVGAVHIGDNAYYEKLNDTFKQYDVLLYELVAPEGTKVERGRGTSNAHPLGAMQNGIKTLLELEHQLEKVDFGIAEERILLFPTLRQAIRAFEKRKTDQR